MHTEDQARKLWCPMVRMGDSDQSPPENRYCPRGIATDFNPEYSRCIASECAMWRWGEERVEHEGYCGIGGKP